MSSFTKPKLIVYLVAIFLAGGVSGGFIGFSLRNERRGPGRPSPEQMIEFVRGKLTDDIGVTAEQWKDIGPIITNSVREIAELDSRNREHCGELIERSDAAIMEKLTPEQKPRMQEWIEERRNHHRKKPEPSNA